MSRIPCKNGSASASRPPPTWRQFAMPARRRCIVPPAPPRWARRQGGPRAPGSHGEAALRRSMARTSAQGRAWANIGSGHTSCGPSRRAVGALCTPLLHSRPPRPCWPSWMTSTSGSSSSARRSPSRTGLPTADHARTVDSDEAPTRTGTQLWAASDLLRVHRHCFSSMHIYVRKASQQNANSPELGCPAPDGRVNLCNILLKVPLGRGAREGHEPLSGYTAGRAGGQRPKSGRSGARRAATLGDARGVEESKGDQRYQGNSKRPVCASAGQALPVENQVTMAMAA
mmetsp:Transcript_2032/g.6258  ORF Transcript_2032/g.6258 Transcript_2032/m.6258 type:complete len:286 (+) Transcript_2032:932-1789(+)